MTAAGQAKKKAEAEADLRSRRPAEGEISEGNLAENPIFVLSNKDARPVRKDPNDPKNVLVNLEDYKRDLDVGEVELQDGRLVRRKLSLTANPQFGFPTVFAYRVLLILCDEAKKQSRFENPVVYISRYEIATRLGYKKPGKQVYDDITNALNAMRTLNLTFEYAWYARAPAAAGDAGEATKAASAIELSDTDARSGPVPNVRTDGLIANFAFVDDRQRALDLDGAGAEASRSHVKLADLLVNSLRRGYYNGIDLDYVNVLKSPLAQSLYIYLAKKDGGPVYKESLRKIAAKLNLAKRAPSQIWEALEPSLRLLCEPLDLHNGLRPRRFIESFNLDKAKGVVHIKFFRTDDEKVKAVQQGLGFWDPNNREAERRAGERGEQ